MPHDKYVQKLTQVLEPYEYVVESIDKMNGNSDTEEDVQEINGLTNGFDQVPIPNGLHKQVLNDSKTFLSNGVDKTSTENHQNSSQDNLQINSYECEQTTIISDDEEDYCDTSDSINEHVELFIIYFFVKPE